MSSREHFVLRRALVVDNVLLDIQRHGGTLEEYDTLVFVSRDDGRAYWNLNDAPTRNAIVAPRP